MLPAKHRHAHLHDLPQSDIPRGEAATLHFNSVCNSCHQIKHTADPNCIGCHMRKRRTQDVVHAVMTDHLIQRRPPSSDPLAQIPERQEFDENRYRGEVVPYYPSPLPRTAENALYMAVAQVEQRSNLAKGLPGSRRRSSKRSLRGPSFSSSLVRRGWALANRSTLLEPLRKRSGASRARQPRCSILPMRSPRRGSRSARSGC